MRRIPTQAIEEADGVGGHVREQVRDLGTLALRERAEGAQEVAVGALDLRRKTAVAVVEADHVEAARDELVAEALRARRSAVRPSP